MPYEAKSTGRRLFSRTEIPMRIMIDGHLLPVLNWSLGGLALAKPCPIALSKDETVVGVLELLVGGVDLSVKVSLRLANEHQDRLGFAFVGLSPEQMGMLRALLVRGGATPLERVPVPVKGASMAQMRRRKGGVRGKAIARWFGRVAAVLALVGVFGAIGAYALIDKSIVHSVEAAVAVPSKTAVSVDRGYVENVIVKPGQSVASGDPLLSLRRRAEPSKAVLVTSPCNCTVLNVLTRAGEEVTVGEPLVQLASSQQANAFVEALIPDGVDLAVGQPVKVVIEGSSVVGRGRVADVGTSRPGSDRFGLPGSLRQDARYRLVVVDNLTGFRSLTPGAAARLQLSDDIPWSDQLRREVVKLSERAKAMLKLPLMEGDDAAG